MESIKFKKSQTYYSLREADTTIGYILGCFLIADVQGNPLKWIQWTNDQSKPYTSSNSSFIDKEDNKIFIYDVLCKDDDGGPYFETTKEQFIKLLEEWDVMLKLMPNEIYINIDDNGIITLEASND
jgi:hypothetical protein